MGVKRSFHWSITKKGRVFLKQNQYPMAIEVFELPPEDGVTRLITFDIPEKDRRKRNWLRKELIACDYTLLQRSVFIGKRPLPEELMTQINELHISQYLHIVSVDKKGTLSKNP